MTETQLEKDIRAIKDEVAAIRQIIEDQVIGTPETKDEYDSPGKYS